jgi:DNA polymerase I-like protein with 3'-5' exonuclease and polymerase domains
MIDWQTTSYIAGVLGTAVASIDKIYRSYADYFKKKAPNLSAPAPDFSIQNRSAENAMVATSLHSGAVSQTVTYEELRARLAPTDRAHIEALSQALENYEKQWNSALLAKSMASGMDVGRYDAQLDYVAQQISAPLLKVLEFVERMGLFLDDHYLAARNIATEYMKTGR